MNYSDKVIEHFTNPRNIGIIREPSILVQIGDPGCGDSLLLMLNIKDDTIIDVKYKIFGCGAAIATSSIASEMVMGKSLEEAMQITDEDIADALGGLPDEKMHCSNLAAGALHAGIGKYLKSTRKS
jgi:nitrogen fixation NifU-like protein